MSRCIQLQVVVLSYRNLHFENNKVIFDKLVLLLNPLKTGHKVNHANRADPDLHPLHHGHRHPLRLLQRDQAAAGRQASGAAAR